MKVTKQQLADTEVALSHWWCGTDFGQMEEDEVEFTDDAIRGAELLAQFDVDTLELLTMWRGYIDAALHVQPTVEDFIIATYAVQRMEE